MVTDSLYTDIPSKEFSDSLFTAVNVLNRHTDSLDGFSGWVTVFSFIASIITIVGLVMIGFEIGNRWTTKRCQKKVILDLVRHFFTNNAISEVIRLKMKGRGSVLKEGIMQRYCVLDSDIELGQLSYSSRSYEQLHSLRVKLRNYNISALCAEKHFADPDCPVEKRLGDLDDILARSVRLTEGFIEFAQSRRMRIDRDVVKKYILDYYNDKDRIPKWREEGKLNPSVKIPPRESGTKRAYYDDTYGLSEIENSLIRERYSYVSFSEQAKDEAARNKPKTKK